MSLPLVNTGVSGNEQDVCIPEPAETLPAVAPVVPQTEPPMPLAAPPATPPLPFPLPLLPEELEQGSANGECRLVNGRRRDGPGKSVGRVRRSAGICC